MSKATSLAALSAEEVTDPCTEFERKVFVGTIITALAGIHTYIVQSTTHGTLRCMALTQGSGFNGGVRVEGQYTPGTVVFCMKTGTAMVGIIIGAIPPVQQLKSQSASATSVMPNSGTDIGTEQQHRIMLQGERDFGTGRNLDSLPGDAGYLSPLGVGWHCSPFGMLVKGSETAQTFYSFVDDSVKELAWNSIKFDSHGQRQTLEDEGELFGHRAVSFFPWESRGSLVPNVMSVKINPLGQAGSVIEGTDKLFELPISPDAKLRYAPLIDNQMGIPRLQEFEGYLGYGRHTVLACPPALAYAAPLVPETMDAPSLYNGLFSESIRMDGRYEVRSAAGILLEKTYDIPVPKQQVDPTDPLGDTGPTVAWSGVFASPIAPAHPQSQYPRPVESVADQEFNAERHIWETVNLTLQGLRKHRLDWSVSLAGMTDLTNPAAVLLRTQFYRLVGREQELPRPTPVSLLVSHSPNITRKIYTNRAYIEIQDDGSIVAEDGYGAQVVLSRGNIKLTAAQDLQIVVGRDFRVMAGGDVIMLGNGDVDLSASTGTVRVKAQEQVQVVSVDQGILLEGRGEIPIPNFSGPSAAAAVYGGVIIHSPNAPAVVIAQSAGVYSDSDVTVSAGQGTANVNVVAKDINETISGTRRELYGTIPTGAAAESQVAIVKDSVKVTVGQAKAAFDHIDSQQVVTGKVVAGEVTAAIATLALAQIANPSEGVMGVQVVVYTPTAAQATANVMAAMASRVKSWTPAHATLPDYAVFTTKVKDVSFRFRESMEYNLDLTGGIVAAPWQFERMSQPGGAAMMWVEPPVTSVGAGASMPWPGMTAWNAPGSFKQPVKPLMDSLVASATPVPAPPACIPLVLNGNFPISC